MSLRLYALLKKDTNLEEAINFFERLNGVSANLFLEDDHGSILTLHVTRSAYDTYFGGGKIPIIPEAAKDYVMNIELPPKRKLY